MPIPSSSIESTVIALNVTGIDNIIFVLLYFSMATSVPGSLYISSGAVFYRWGGHIERTVLRNIQEEI